MTRSEVIEAAIGREIQEIRIDDNRLEIRFVGPGPGIQIWDGGQCCCESRYMKTDDDLTFFASSVFYGARIAAGKTEFGEYGDTTECDFLIVSTSKGEFTIANYNAHNGYYGGICLEATEL